MIVIVHIPPQKAIAKTTPFVDKKGNKQWVWLALEADNREIIGVYIGGLAKRGTATLMQCRLESFPDLG